MNKSSLTSTVTKKSKGALATASKKAAASASKPSGRPRAFSDDQKIVSIKANPKREGGEAYKRYNLYRKGATVAETLKSGVTRADLLWDTRKGFVEVK